MPAEDRTALPAVLAEGGSRAADGFNLVPPILPALLDTFVAEVVPILQRRDPAGP